MISNSKIMCAVIKVDVNKNYINREYFDRTYIIPYKTYDGFDMNPDELINYINTLGIKYQIPIIRTYISGFVLASISDIWNKEDLDNHFKNFSNTNILIKTR